MRENPSHILYLWHVSYKYGILQTVRQQLNADVSLDGATAPSVASARKRKSSPGSLDDSSQSAMSRDLRRMTTSIDGLVGVAKLDILQRRRRELEQSRHELDVEIMDLELRSVAESLPARVAIYERALQRKNAQLTSIQQDLDEVTRQISTSQQEMISPSANLLPRFVDVGDTEATATTENATAPTDLEATV